MRLLSLSSRGSPEDSGFHVIASTQIVQLLALGNLTSVFLFSSHPHLPWLPHVLVAINILSTRADVACAKDEVVASY